MEMIERNMEVLEATEVFAEVISLIQGAVDYAENKRRSDYQAVQAAINEYESTERAKQTAISEAISKVDTSLSDLLLLKEEVSRNLSSALVAGDTQKAEEYESELDSIGKTELVYERRKITLNRAVIPGGINELRDAVELYRTMHFDSRILSGNVSKLRLAIDEHVGNLRQLNEKLGYYTNALSSLSDARRIFGYLEHLYKQPIVTPSKAGDPDAGKERFVMAVAGNDDPAFDDSECAEAILALRELLSREDSEE